MSTLVLDGVFARDRAGTLGFHSAPRLTALDVAEVLATVEPRIGRLLDRRGLEQMIAVATDPAASLTPAARTAALDYQDKVAKLPRSFTGASEQANNMKTRATAIRRALVDSPAELKLLDEAVAFDRRVTAVLRQLRGDETLRGLESGSPSSISSRVNSAAAGARGLSGAPTGTQQLNYNIAFEELAAEITTLKALETELKKFEQQLEAAGVPYTPGRWPGQGRE